ncbi:MAG: Phosphopantetheine adenylyltransferase, partial [uncultured Nocardioides sp.]
ARTPSCRVPRFVRPGDQRTPRHRGASGVPVRRGRGGGGGQRLQEPPVHRRRAHRDAPDRLPRPAQRACRRVRRAAHRLLPGARHRRHREGPAGGERLRLRAADGADELQPRADRDGVRADEPRVLLPGLLAGQGGRRVRGRRRRPGARLRARPAEGAAGRAHARAV